MWKERTWKDQSVPCWIRKLQQKRPAAKPISPGKASSLFVDVKLKLEAGVTRKCLEGCQTSRGRSRQDNWDWYRCGVDSIFDLGKFNTLRGGMLSPSGSLLRIQAFLSLQIWCASYRSLRKSFPLSNASVKKETEWRDVKRVSKMSEESLQEISCLLQVVKEETGFELWIGSLEERATEQ